DRSVTGVQTCALPISGRGISRGGGDLAARAGGGQARLEIRPEVLAVLEPHAEAHGAGAHAAGLALRVGEVGVGGGRGMADERARSEERRGGRKYGQRW